MCDDGAQEQHCADGHKRVVVRIDPPSRKEPVHSAVK